MTKTTIRATCVAPLLLSLLALAQVDGAPLVPTKVDRSVDQEQGRLRWGVNAQLGLFSYSFPELGGLMVGAEGRLGYQLGRRMAVYGTVAVAAGLGSSEISLNTLLYVSSGVLAELTLFDHLFVALGPTLALGGWSGLLYVDTRGGHVVYTFRSVQGPIASLDFKLGVGVGGRDAQSGRRSHFTIAIDVLVLFAPDAATHELAVCYAPTLMLG